MPKHTGIIAAFVIAKAITFAAFATAHLTYVKHTVLHT
jgi:hypothetical protein